MNLMFSWQEQYLTSERSGLVRYCSSYSNIKFISSRHRVISCIYYICTEIYSVQTRGIKIISLWREAISLVIRFFSLVKNIVWPIRRLIRFFSQVRKFVSVFPAFRGVMQSNWEWMFTAFPAFPKSWPRGPVEQFIEAQENETTRKKTQHNVEKSRLSQVSECSTTTVH